MENEKSPKTARDQHVEAIGRRYKYNETESLAALLQDKENKSNVAELPRKTETSPIRHSKVDRAADIR